MSLEYDINTFFIKLRSQEAAIWLEGDKIRFSAPKSFMDETLEQYIVENRMSVIEILRENEIYSAQIFKLKIILRYKLRTGFPLSPAQERLWFIEQYEHGTNAYHMPRVYELGENCKWEMLKKSLQKIVSRHEILRTTIRYDVESASVWQVVNQEVLSVEEIDLSSGEDVRTIMQERIDRSFDLTSEYPIRVTLFNVLADNGDPARRILLINTHHIAGDGWSLKIFEYELKEYYNAFFAGNDLFQLPDLGIQYKDYAIWQKSYLSEEVLQKQLAYWENKLRDYKTLDIHTDFPRPNKIDYKGAHIGFSVSEKTSSDLRRLAADLGVTLYDVMLSALAVLLGKYTGQDDIIIGTVTANRHHLQTRELIGFFINTQVHRVLLQGENDILQLIEAVHSDSIDAQLHQDVPFEKIVDRLKVDRDLSRHSVFQVMFTMDSFIDNQNIIENKEDFYIKPVYYEESYEIEKFDLSVFVNDNGNEIEGEFRYATGLFGKLTIENLINKYLHVLGRLIADPHTNYSDFSLLNKTEYHDVIYNENEPVSRVDKNRNIAEIFAECVKKNQLSVALLHNSDEMSYQELNEKSNQLAYYIRESYYSQCNTELSGNVLIPICVNRGFEMIVSVLAVLKTGAAYVPVDPSYPAERISYILQDVSPRIIIAGKGIITPEMITQGATVIYADLSGEIFQSENVADLSPSCTGNDLAYVIYTSGTTGKPKGVMVDQKAVISFACNNNFIDIDKVNCVGGASNYAFDGSIFDIFFSLLNGKKLVILDKDSLLDPEQLDEQFYHNKIDTVFITTALFNSLVKSDSKCLKNIRQLLFGGERSNFELVRKFVLHYKNTDLIHVYGPTENIVFSTFCKLTEKNTLCSAPIGKRLADKKLYVLDKNMMPVPVGVAGELFIGGSGIARGYLNNDELTLERFINNPFATDEDRHHGEVRIYKTGDLVKRLPDGNLEYLNRNDDQVKIRGFRIELSEIEHAILNIPGINDVCVLVRELNNIDHEGKILVAYIVTGNSVIDRHDLQKKLLKYLPEYMVPAAFVLMESLPLNSNGKIDKNKLPESFHVASSSGNILPSNESEKRIAEIWSNVLGVGQVGVNDNFFRIGGDSILSIQLAAKLRQAGFSCKVVDIFRYSTIAKLAAHLSIADVESYQSEQGDLSGEIGLLPIQKWFLNAVDAGIIKNENHFNHSFLVKVPTLSVPLLQEALKKFISFHDLLRAYFVQENGSWKQFYQNEIPVPVIHTLNVSEYSENETDRILTEWQSSFDIRKGKLLEVGYIYGYSDGSARLYFALHHLIVDTVSWRIIIDSIKAFYDGQELSRKSASYRQWINVISEYYKKEKNEAQYWKCQLEGLPAFPETINVKDGCIKSVEIDSVLTEALLREAAYAYNTGVNELLLSALAYALKAINQSEIQGITLEGHGREDIDLSIDLSNTIGWFTTMFPVRLEVKNTIGGTIRANKESLREIPNKGLGFGVFAADGEHGVEFNSLPRIAFNYLGQFDNKEGMWQVISEYSGDNFSDSDTNHNIISINGIVSGGKLKFDFDTRLDFETTTVLCEAFKEHLVQIIYHCCKNVREGRISHSPGDFSYVKISQSHLDKLDEKAWQNKNEIVKIFPATSLQQGFLFHVLSHPEDDAYYIQTLVDYRGRLDVDVFRKSWELCVEQFPVLRTAFDWDNGVFQVVYKAAELKFFYHDISNLNSEEERETEILKIQQNDRKHFFDFSEPGLFRIHFIKQAEDFYTVLRNTHHCIMDGWSDSVLLSCQQGFYEELSNGKMVIPVEDDAFFRIQEYMNDNKSEINRYWDKRMDVVAEINDISSFFNKKIINLENYSSVNRQETVELVINNEIYHEIKKFSVQQGITMNVVVQFAWHKLIQIFANAKQSIVGITVSGRDLPVEGIETSVGLYINTLPLVIGWDDELSVLDKLQEIQKEVTELNNNSFADLSRLQKDGQRLFQNIFVFENFPDTEVNETDFSLEFRAAVEKGNYPLGLTVYETKDELVVKLSFDADYLDYNLASSHLQRLKNCLYYTVTNFEKSHGTVCLLFQDEYDEIVYRWNDTQKDFPPNHSIISAFQNQVKRDPLKVAVVSGLTQLTYQETDERSGKLAACFMQQYAIGRNDKVVIMLDRSENLMLSILAVLKTGAAYTCIDPAQKSTRNEYILNDIKPVLLITQTDYIFDIDFYVGKIFAIDVQFDEINSYETSFEESVVPRDAAYVIYTSGTSGAPKGVVVSHGSVLNYVQNVGEILLPEVSNIDFSTSVAFDLTVTTTIAALLLGKTIVVYEGNVSEVSCYISHLIDNSVDFIKGTPSFLASLDVEDFCGYKIRQVFVGGEKLEESQRNVINQYALDIIDEYGPTETTVGATYKRKNSSSSIGIGMAYYNYKVYVLDMKMNPVPVGIPGELYIGGAGVALGYLNQDELTAQRFVPDLFADNSDKEKRYNKLYKTGDLVKWVSPRNLAYLGRNDEQVKIRGYRIELGEIENELAKIPGIKTGCVLVKERPGKAGSIKYLVAYYVSDDAAVKINVEGIREHLFHVLPEYMIPQVIVEIEKIPLTRNGKVDKRALLALAMEETGDIYLAPRNSFETTISEIWKDVLNVNQVGIRDDFFRIGGDSILSIMVSGRLRQLGYNCHVKDVFDLRTVENLANHLNQSHSDKLMLTEQGSLSGGLYFLPVQMWFIHKVEQGELSHFWHWNHSFLIRVPVLDPGKLIEVTEKLVMYHDVFRMVFETGSTRSDWHQRYQDKIIMPELEMLDVAGLTEEEICEVLTRWQSDFNLEQGSLFRIGYLYGYTDLSARVFLAAHHLLIDTVSWRIIVNDLKSLYEGNNLPLKGSSYRQWTSKIKEYNTKFTSEAQFWIQQLKDIPLYQPAEKYPECHGFFELDSNITGNLLSKAPKAFNTEINDLLLTALAYALSEINHNRVQGITMESHGRSDFDAEIDHSRAVGWFTSMFPLKLELQDTIEESICVIKECIREIPNKGVGFGAFAITGESGFDFSDLPPVSFNYLGQFDTSDNLSAWQITGENSGMSSGSDNIDHNVINIIGKIMDGVLKFDITAKIGSPDLIRLSEAFRKNIEIITRLCVERTVTFGSDFTPADFKDFVPFEVFNEHLDEEPLFIFPPGAGGAYSYYNNILPGLKHRKVVLFNNYYTHRYFSGVSNKGYTMENIAKYYVRIMKKIQSSGTYTCIGWSFGGVLAFEALRQLNNAFYTNKLFAVDSWFSQKIAAIGMPHQYLEEFRHNINYGYQPVVDDPNLKVVLFKALKRQQITEEYSEPEAIRFCEDYYMNNDYNGLDVVFENITGWTNLIEIIKLESNHNEILEKYSDLIVQQILISCAEDERKETIEFEKT